VCIFELTAGTKYPFWRHSSLLEARIGELSVVPSAEYYLRQAEVAARLALAESEPTKAAALHLLALEQYHKAEKAKAAEAIAALERPILSSPDRIS
jgi:hypothetical protein